MHHRFIVLIDKHYWVDNKIKKGETLKDLKKRKKEFQKKIVNQTSLKIRKEASRWLYDEGFVDQKTFASGPADWFVIGGRWSGYFTTELLNPLLWKACNEKLWEEKDKTGMDRFAMHLTSKQYKYASKMFYDFFPKFKGILPLSRDSYKELGYKDDAIIVTDLFWKRVIKEKLKMCEDDPFEDPIVYVGGMTRDCKKKEVVGKMWAVLIDFHS